MVQCNHKSPLKWKREAEPLSEWCLLMVSKMEGAVSQGLQADSRAGKGNKMDFPLEFNLYFRPAMASLVAQRLKRLPAVQETWVWSLSQEDPLEKEMATYSSIRSWRIPWRDSFPRCTPGLMATWTSRDVLRHWWDKTWKIWDERSVQDQKVRRLDPWNTAACRDTQGEVAGLQNTLKKCCLIWRHHILGKMDEACGRTIRVGFLKLGKILKMAHAFGHKEK